MKGERYTLKELEVFKGKLVSLVFKGTTINCWIDEIELASNPPNLPYGLHIRPTKESLTALETAGIPLPADGRITVKEFENIILKP